MPGEFFAELTYPELADELVAFAPTNPYCTSAYAAVMRASGSQVWVFGIRLYGRMTVGCQGFLQDEWPNRVLQLPSLPDLSGESAFWPELYAFCSRQCVTYLQVSNLAFRGTQIPLLPNEVLRQRKCEYFLDLQDPNWERRLHPRHRQSVGKAQRAGATWRRSVSKEACHRHARLLMESMRRRRGLGRPAMADHEIRRYLRSMLLFTQKGFGELHEAVVDTAVMSSAMILRAPEGACGYTMGTSGDGLQCGASHFLQVAVARTLCSESAKVFNLGESELGEDTFKARFGATASAFDRVFVYLGSPFRWQLTRAARFLRRNVAGIAWGHAALPTEKEDAVSPNESAKLIEILSHLQRPIEARATGGGRIGASFENGPLQASCFLS
jgi:hypothetical protein